MGAESWNLGELWATNTLFDANWTGEGGNGLGCVTSAEDPWAQDICIGGDGGSGGALSNHGYASLEQVELRGNYAGAGGAGGDAFYRTDGGNGGNGGGLFNSGMLTIHKFLIEENAAGEPGPKRGRRVWWIPVSWEPWQWSWHIQS